MYLNKRVAQERDTAALLQTTEDKGSRREGGRDGRKKEDMISYWKQSQKKGHESFKAIRARHQTLGPEMGKDRCSNLSCL